MNIHKNEKLIEAFDEYVRLQNDLLPDEEALSSITFSEEFRERMHRLLSRQKYGFYVLFGTAGRRIASFLVAALVAASVTTISVEALREPVFQFFAEVYEKFTQVFFVDDEPKTSTAEFKIRIPTFVPEGYVVESKVETDTVHKIVYSNNNGSRIRYSQQFKESVALQADTEGVQYTNVVVGDYQAITYSNKGFLYIVFSDDKYTYTFSGNIYMDELQKMAESLIS